LFSPLRYLYLGCIVSISLMLMACGQKGGLYLPEIPEAPNVLSDRPAISADPENQEAVTESAEQDRKRKQAEDAPVLPASENHE
jgi:predicted small lipoprotein YifL